jgi:hypothetical protein
MQGEEILQKILIIYSNKKSISPGGIYSILIFKSEDSNLENLQFNFLFQYFF